MGVIKDLWESSKDSKAQNEDLASWFARWKYEHPEYVKTTKSTNTEKYKHKHQCKSRTFE